MKHTDQISSIVFLIFAIITVYLSARIPMGNVNTPGPGFLPFWLGILLVLISTFLWIQSAKQDIPEPRPRALSVKNPGAKEVVWTASFITAYSLLMEHFGFVFCTLILLFLLFRMIGKQKWLVSIVWTILVTLASHLIFAVALKVQLPKGIFKI